MAHSPNVGAMGKDSKIKEERRLTRQIAKAIEELRTKESNLSKYLRGAAGLLVSTAVAMVTVGSVGPAFFWVAVVLFYVGFACFAYDIWLERWRLLWKGLWWACLFIFAVFIAWVVVLPTEPLAVNLTPHYGNFKEGETVGGIQWEKNFSELRISFSNPSEQSYDDLDMVILTDLFIAQHGLIDAPPNCSLRLHQSPTALGARLKGKDNDGRPTEQLMSSLGDSGPYLLHCDKLLPRDTAQVIFALVGLKNEDVMDWMKSKQKEHLKEADINKPWSIFGPKKLPEWAAVNGRYKVFLRPYAITKQAKLSGE
jgi:hypothetical protein